MIDHQFRRGQRVDGLGLATKLDDGVAHRRKIDHCWHAGKVLQDHARRRERDFMAGLRLRIPVGQRPNIVRADIAAVGMAEQVFHQDLQRVGQPLDMPVAHGVEPVDLVVPAVDGQRRFRIG